MGNRVVSQAIPKVDYKALVTGKAVYTDDLAAKDSLVVKVLRSPYAHALIEDINLTRAELVPDIECILTYKDCPDKRFTMAGQTYPEPSPYDRLILDQRVRFVGDAVAIVAGRTKEAVNKALKLIKVKYEVLEPVLDFHKAKDNPILVHPEENWKSLCPVGADNKRNLCAHDSCEEGDIEAVLANCEYIIDQVYYTKANQQAMMETFRTYTYLDTYGRLNVLSSTQVPFHVRRILANALDIPKSKIRVIKPRIGGGFGAKQSVVSVKSDFLAGLGFGATQQLGENTGIYIGYSVDTGRNVYLQPSLASQGVKGTVTNALASAFVGSLGGGKSFCNNLLVYYSVLFGGQAVILDPKSERGNWKETLPEIAHEINIVNLTSDKDNAGLLDPFVIMKNVKDAESLAIDILTFLTGISSRDGEKFPVLRKAVRAVTQSDKRGLLHVIDELRREDTPISRNIADHIDSFTDYDFAHLLFSDGTVENAISLDNQLNIIQVADLVLPDKDTTFEEYTTIELLSVSMLIVISTFALDFIHSDRSIFKIVDLDEAWAFLNVAQGETLSNKLVRAGRAMQAGVYFVTQSSGDVSKESLKNNIGLKFAFRSTDINEIKQTLEFFGIDKDDENNQKRLRDLENGQCLLQDLYGRVGVVQIHPVFEELLHAFDTRPPVKRNEVE